jgi:uncharacterized membrane protein YphA (DoxX/SURF4 family)
MLAVKLVALVIGVIFIWSGVPKLYHPYQFLAAVYSYQLLGLLPGRLLAMVLPWTEVLVGFCLVAGIAREAGLLTAAMLCSMFLVAQIWALAHSLPISCACFSGSGELITYSTLGRTFLMLLCAVFCYGYSVSNASASSERPPRPRAARPSA